MKSGLKKIKPRRTDFSLLRTFKKHPDYGAIIAEPSGLPNAFSIYDGRAIPNQQENDTRFPFLIPPLPMGCTGETGAFETGIQDGKLYNPQDLYLNTPDFDPHSGRDIRVMLQTLINRGVKDGDGNFSPLRKAYFNCYGTGKIDDYEAAKIGIWINQSEKRGVYIGTWWYWGLKPLAYLPLPTFKISDAGLHCYLVTGWNGEYLEVIPWLGDKVGAGGKFYLSREIYNTLMKQPYTGAFTLTKMQGYAPIPVGYQAIIDHLVYYVRSLFKV